MVWKLRYKLVIVWSLVLLLFFSLLLINVINLPSTSQAECCKCSPNVGGTFRLETNVPSAKVNYHHLAILVPFRDRFEELQEFVPRIHSYLNNQSISHEIVIVNQVDGYRFNRAALINVGFRYVQNSFVDYIAMHDVDLLPTNPELKYEYPGEGKALHLASPKFHPKYNYSTFVGGILLLTNKDFIKLNGLSNKYWGWGLEDDEFYVRMKQGGITVVRPDHITTGRHNTFKHLHDAKKRVRDKERCFNQKEASRKRDRLTGLDTVAYETSSVVKISIDSAPAIILNVELVCDKNVTPWCTCR